MDAAGGARSEGGAAGTSTNTAGGTRSEGCGIRPIPRLKETDSSVNML